MDSKNSKPDEKDVQDFENHMADSRGEKPKASVEGEWNSNDPSYPALSSEYGTNIQYKPLGQYSKGLIDDFAASYRGLTQKDREMVLEDPAGYSRENLEDVNGPVDPNAITGSRVSMSETGKIDSNTDRQMALEVAAAGTTIGTSGNATSAKGNVIEWLDNGNKQPFAKALGSALSLAGGSVGVAGALLNLFQGSSSVYTGAAVDNAESAEALAMDGAALGAHAEVGEKTLDAQSDTMDKIAERLSVDEEGNYKDPAYAMQTVNQLMRLSGNDPAFISKDDRALPEATTGGDAVDIPLPGNVFATGAGGPRRDASHALINESNDRTGIDQIADANAEDAQAGNDIGQAWGDCARDYVGRGDYDDASARETGATRMANDVDGQLDATGSSMDRYNKSLDNLLEKVRPAMDSANWGKIAEQAGPAIRESYAKQEGVTDVDTTQPVEIGVNPLVDDQNGRDGLAFFDKMADNSRTTMKGAYSMELGSPLWQAQQEMHGALMGSGPEISPAPALQKMTMDHVLDAFADRSGEPDAETRASRREDFINSFTENKGMFPDGQNNVGSLFKGGIDVRLDFKMFGEGDEDRSTGNFTIKTDKADATGEEIAGQIFDQIWDRTAGAVGEDNQGSSFTQVGSFFTDVTLNGVVPVTGEGDAAEIGGDDNLDNDRLTQVPASDGRSVPEPKRTGGV